jgi:tetratricopeptide (TPR) repeat protein
MLRSLLVLYLVFASPALAQEYQSKELADAAHDWRQQLTNSVPANKKQPGLIAGWRRAADADYQAKRYAAAINELTRAIANGADDGLVWLRLAQNELATEDDHAMASGYNAYFKSTDPVERGVALFVIGREYDRHDKQKEALAAFDAGLAFTQLPSIAERAEELRRLVAFRVTKGSRNDDQLNTTVGILPDDVHGLAAPGMERVVNPPLDRMLAGSMSLLRAAPG